jgi:hypothetical protein
MKNVSTGDIPARDELKRRVVPWLVVLAVLAAAAFELRVQGRLWLCSCGHFRPWYGEAWGPETSQQLLDPYSFTHMLHGFIFAGLLALLLRRANWRWRVALGVAAEALWEVIENTEYVINRYREATASLGYNGDTVVNSLGDIIACTAGVLLARKLGLLKSLLVFALTEVTLLIWIRDSLLLNIVLLVYPSEALKAWQAGH